MARQVLTPSRSGIERALALQYGQQALAVGRTARFDDEVEDQAAPAGGQVEFVAVGDLAALVAQNTSRRSAVDRRTTRQAGYALSQRIRKRIEAVFDWIKTTRGLRKTRHRGTARVGWLFTITAIACNLVRLPKLLEVG